MNWSAEMKETFAVQCVQVMASHTMLLELKAACDDTSGGPASKKRKAAALTKVFKFAGVSQSDLEPDLLCVEPQRSWSQDDDDVQEEEEEKEPEGEATEHKTPEKVPPAHLVD